MEEVHGGKKKSDTADYKSFICKNNTPKGSLASRHVWCTDALVLCTFKSTHLKFPV